MDSASAQTRARRIAVLIALFVLVLSASTATPAAAHANPAHFATKITSIDPAVPGLHVSTSSDGAYMVITNPTQRIVIVLGYDHERYLKVTKRGVWHNTHSPATYLNEDLAADAMTAGVNAAAAPACERISNSNSCRFDDRRIHWIGNSRPAAVEQNPKKAHLIRNWTVDLLVDDTPVTVRGTLKWYPATDRPPGSSSASPARSSSSASSSRSSATNGAYIAISAGPRSDSALAELPDKLDAIDRPREYS